MKTNTLTSCLKTLTAATIVAGASMSAGVGQLHAQQPRPAGQPATQPRTLSLEDALSLVVRHSEAVRIAEAGERRAAGQLRQARSQLFPQLTGTASYQRTLQSQFEAISKSAGGDEGDGGEGPPADSSGGSLADNPISRIFASENTVVLGLQGSQTIYSGGRLTAQRRASEAGRRVARIGITTAEAQATLDVAQAYYDAVLADRMVAIAESSLVQTQRALRQTELGQSVGTTAEFDLLRARVTRDNQLPLVIQARTQRATSMLRLRQLLDLPLEQPVVLTTDLESGAAAAAAAALGGTPAAEGAPVARVDAPVDVDALLAAHAPTTGLVTSAVAEADTSVGSRAPVRQAAEAVEIQRQLLRVQKGERLPGISLSSTYQRFAYPVSGLPGLNAFYPNWTVSLGLQLPILTGGRIAGQVEEAEAGLAEARAQLQQVEELAALDVQLVVAQLEQAAAAYAASAGTAGQAERAYAIAEVRFREGISTQVELDDSRLLLQQALANRAQAARDLNVARMRLALIDDLPLGAGQGGAAGATQGGAGQGAAGSSSGGVPARSASATTSPPAGGSNQQGTSGGMTP